MISGLCCLCERFGTQDQAVKREVLVVSGCRSLPDGCREAVARVVSSPAVFALHVGGDVVGVDQWAREIYVKLRGDEGLCVYHSDRTADLEAERNELMVRTAAARAHALKLQLAGHVWPGLQSSNVWDCVKRLHKYGASVKIHAHQGMLRR